MAHVSLVGFLSWRLGFPQSLINQRQSAGINGCCRALQNLLRRHAGKKHDPFAGNDAVRVLRYYPKDPKGSYAHAFEQYHLNLYLSPH